MERVTAYITGNVQRVGYRGKVIDLAKAFGLKGNVQNLEDGRVKVIAEGEENDLERFIRAIDIKNAIIYVSSIASKYSPATGDFEGFYKQVSPGETDSRLDSAVVHLKDLKDAINNMNSNLGGKMDLMIGKQDVMIQKQDQMIQKQDQMIQKQDRMLSGQDELLVEVKDLNRNMSDKMDLMIKRQDERLEKVEDEIADMKTALKAKGII
jgi:acylphosphatase